MKKINQVILVLAVLLTYLPAFALDAPTLTVTTVGTNVDISWSSVNNATGYTLFYAPYPTASPIGSIDMGTGLSVSTDLPLGSAFYVAVQAYNS